nr:PREDICTED: uncharacterized protein LOC109037534 isoform X2 [Bemisia tabaci]
MPVRSYKTRVEKLLEFYHNDPCQHGGMDSCREAMRLFKGLPKKKRDLCAFVDDYTCTYTDVCMFRDGETGKPKQEKSMKTCIEEAKILVKPGKIRRWMKGSLNAVRKMIPGKKKGHMKNALQHEDHKDGDPRHEDSTDENPKNRGPEDGKLNG